MQNAELHTHVVGTPDLGLGAQMTCDVGGRKQQVADLVQREGGEAITIDGNTLPIVKTYADVPPNTLLAYVGSMGTIEIAVRDGRADTRLIAPRGTPVVPVPVVGPYR